MPERPNITSPRSAVPPAEVVREQLERILASAEFARSRRHRKLIRYLVETTLAGDLRDLKESVLAVEVFDRMTHTFDPRRDPIVRVEVRRLRERLRSYYGAGGAQDPVVIDVPVGAYRAVVRRRNGWQRTAPTRAEIPPEAPEAQARPSCAADGAAVERVRPVVAVLPFDNGTEDVAYAALGHAIADELTAALERHPLIRVAVGRALEVGSDLARLPDAAARLGVSVLVQGRIEKADELLVVSARIGLVPDTGLVWASTYRTNPRDFIRLLRQLAQEIVAALPPGGRQAVPAVSPELPRAEVLYRQARAARERMTAADTRESIALAREAVLADPRHARAHAQLGNSLISLPFFEERAITAAEREEVRRALYTAFALDPDDAIVVLALASYSLQHEYDWPEAARFCRRALALAPGDGGALRAYGVLMEFAGRFAEADRYYRRALEIEPDSEYTRGMLTAVPLLAGDFGEAERRARQLLGLRPADLQGHLILVRALIARHRWRDALVALDETLRELPDSRMFAALRLVVRARVRGTPASAVLLDEWGASVDAFASPIVAAGVFAIAQQPARVFKFLELAFEGRDANLPLARFSPEFNDLHADPRFAAILQRMPRMRADAARPVAGTEFAAA